MCTYSQIQMLFSPTDKLLQMPQIPLQNEEATTGKQN